MASQPSQLELERQKRIAENMRRMAEIGLSQAVEELQASQQAEAARVVLKKRTVTERVFVREEDLRRSSRWEKKDVNYNEHAFFKDAEAALERARGTRRIVVTKTRKVSDGSCCGGGGRAVRCSGWSLCMGMAGNAAMDRCLEAAEECASGLANTAFVKSLSMSMVSGGFWCTAPRGMTQTVAQELGINHKCSLMAHLPESQAVPADACHANLAGDGWIMVWLPRKGEFGFSGGWRSFSLDMKLFPGDCVVVELVPKAQHRGEQDTEFTIVLHVFRALDYETEGEKAARQAAQQAADIEVKEEVKQEEGVGETDRPEDQPTQPLTQEDVGAAPRVEGSPAAVDAAAAELSGEPQQGQQAAQQVQQAGKRKRQAKLADGSAKRTRRSSSADGNKASPAGTQAAAGAGGSAAAGKKGRGGGSKTAGGAAKAAAGKAAGGAGKKRQSKAAAAPVAQEEESFDVERIMAVRPAAAGSGKEYLIKWLGWADEWNSWEPRHHLDRPLTEYQLADGLALADLQ